MGSSFLDNAYYFNFLRIASYLGFVVCLHDSVIISGISSAILLLQIVSLIIEQLAASSLVKEIVSFVCLMVKSITSCFLVTEVGIHAEFSPSKVTKIGSTSTAQS